VERGILTLIRVGALPPYFPPDDQLQNGLIQGLCGAANDLVLACCHNEVTTPHLLWAIADRDNSPGCFLRRHGASAVAIRAALDESWPGEQRLEVLMGKLAFSPSVRSALVTAVALAQELSHDAADERHVLVSILGSGEPILAAVLDRLSIRIPNLCPELADLLDDNSV
jgi:ATP-dependent Clp protease ATP-binding subunit ClpA